MRKLSLFVCIVLILGCGCLIYADDPEELPISSGDSGISTFAEDAIKDIDNSIKAVNDNVRAVTYTITDLYNLTYDIFYNTSGSTPVNEIVTIRQRVNTINTNISNMHTFEGSIAVNTAPLHNDIVKLQDILDDDYDTVGISLASRIGYISDHLFDINDNDGYISMMELMLVMDSYLEYLEDISTDIANIKTSNNSIDTKLGYTNSHLSDIFSESLSTNNKLSNIYSKTSNIDTKVNSFYSRNHTDLTSIYDDLHDLHEVYASQDYIDAKEDQQNYEDAAIEDFTGSGSAAASISDMGDLKSVSTTIRNGLDTGGSTSNALAVFNSGSGFWDWFSQSNYNDINNLSTPNRSNPPEVIDFYSSNQMTLQGLLGGDNR